MFEVWVVLGLVAAVSNGGFNIYLKKVIADSSPVAVAFQSQLFAFPVLLVVALTAGDQFPSLPVVGILLASAGFNAVSFVLFARALELDDLSLIAPMRAIIPVAVALIEPVILPLGYTLPALLAAGIATVGMYVLLIDTDPFAPLRNVTRSSVQFGLASSLLIVGPIILDRYAVTQYAISPTAYPVYLVALTTLMLGGFLAASDRFDDVRPATVFVPLGVFRAAIVGAGLFAMSLTSGTNVQVLLQTGLLIAVVAGGQMFDEKYLRYRITGGVLLVAASTVIVIYG